LVVDERTSRYLYDLRPDVILGMALSDEVWGREVRMRALAGCYYPLTADLLEDPSANSILGLTSIYPLLRRRYVGNAPPAQRNWMSVTAEPSCSLAPYVPVVFGDPDPWWNGRSISPQQTEPPQRFTAANPVADFIRFCTENDPGRFRSWLDIANEGLNVHLSIDPINPPTIVAVNRPSDLALAWNLRTVGAEESPTWVIPIPLDALTERDVLDALVEWVIRIQRYGMRPNCCHLVSLTAPLAQLQSAAAALLPLLKEHGFEFVDPFSPCDVVAKVIPFEYDQSQLAEVETRHVTMTIPAPRLSEHMTDQHVWMVDVTRDATARRGLADLHLPARASAVEALNVPGVPALPSRNEIHRFGFDDETICFRCRRRDRVLAHQLPSDEEVLLEVLYDGGMRPLEDEKRNVYEPALKMLGGLSTAARAVTGRLREVLGVLHRCNTADLSTIRREAKLGNGRLPEELSRPSNVANYLRRASPTTRRISLGRFQAQWDELYPDDTKIQTLLEHWAQRGLLIHRPDNHYELQPQLAAAMREGLIPVALTGRFLDWMTYSGFMWVPGIKYEIAASQEKGDIDILAACDGHLVFAECKNMVGASPTEESWERDIWPQFAALVHAAKACGGDLAVLASLAEEYPSGWLERAQREAGQQLSVMLLTRSDLDRGYRRENGQTGSRLSIEDVVHPPAPPNIIRFLPGRTIDYGAFQFGHIETKPEQGGAPHEGGAAPDADPATEKTGD
jgi:hypothetical protein